MQGLLKNKAKSTALYSLTVCKPAYSEPVPKHRNKDVVAEKVYGIKIPWGT